MTQQYQNVIILIRNLIRKKFKRNFMENLIPLWWGILVKYAHKYQFPFFYSVCTWPSQFFPQEIDFLPCEKENQFVSFGLWWFIIRHEYLFGYQAKDLCIFMHRKYGSAVNMVVSTGHFWLNNGGAGHDAAPWKVLRIVKFYEFWVLFNERNFDELKNCTLFWICPATNFRVRQRIW